MRLAPLALGSAFLVLAPSPARSQTLETLLEAGEPVVGLGSLTAFQYLASTDGGRWAVLVDTDFADTQSDGGLLLDGFLALRERTILFDPPAFELDDWISLGLANDGDLGMLLRIRREDIDEEGNSTVTNRTGAFWNLIPVALNGDELTAPGLPAGTEWARFDGVKLSAANDLFVLGELATSATARQDALVHYRLGPAGEVLDAEVPIRQAQFLDVLGTVVGALSTGEHLWDVNDRGEFLMLVPAVGGDAILLGTDRVVAQELAPAPVPGRNWKVLNFTKLSLNDRGDYAFSGTLDGDETSDYLIEHDGRKLVQSGDVIPALSADPLDTGGAAPLVLANTGDVYWSARFRDSEDQCFARNLEPVVKRGQVLPDGSVVSEITAAEHGFAVSPGGRFFLGRVELQDVGPAVLFADFGLVLELPGCAGSPASLRLVDGKALAGGSFTLALDGAQVSGAIPALSFGTRLARPDSECGLMTPFGELLLSPADVRRTLVLPAWTGAAVEITFNVPNDVALVDALFFAQGAFFDPHANAPEKFRTTNGLRIEIGAP